MKNWSTQFLVVHREKHGFDNMRINEKNESKLKKEIFLELDTSEIQRVIIVFSFLCSRVNIRYQKVIKKNVSFVTSRHLHQHIYLYTTALIKF